MPNGLTKRSENKQSENKQSENKKVTSVNVAVAVIHYNDKYLLGFRDAAQHQGNRYEFVGGKIESDETATLALIREVAEETGIAIDDNTIVKLGRLHHDYGDKQVSLQVYRIELTAEQYEQHKRCEYGLEGQAITWVDRSELLAGEYHLPAANKTILDWLRLPPSIAITYPLSHFSAHTDAHADIQANTHRDKSIGAAWLQYHQAHLAADAWVYIRLQHAEAKHIAEQLLSMRPDIRAIVPYSDDSSDDKRYSDNGDHKPSHTQCSTESEDTDTASQIIAQHLTHDAVVAWSNDTQDSSMFAQALADKWQLSQKLPLVVSCHDAASISAANRLAAARLRQQLPPVIAVFLSPVLATQTHPDTPALGWEAWSALAQLADMPVIGLGGLSPLMIEHALEYGGISVAGIRQFLRP